MIRILLILSLGWTALALAEPLLEQSFDDFPLGQAKLVTSSDLAGRWHGFGSEGSVSEIQDQTARDGNSVKLYRPDGVASASQAIYAYFVPTSDLQIIVKFWMYFEQAGSLRCALDNWQHYLAAVELGTNMPQVLDGELGKWRKEQSLALPAGVWHEIVIHCNRKDQTYTVTERAENESKPVLVASDIPLSPNASDVINLIEFHILEGGPIYIDDLSIESQP